MSGGASGGVAEDRIEQAAVALVLTIVVVLVCLIGALYYGIKAT